MWEDVGVLAGANHFHGGHRAAGLQVAEVQASAVRWGGEGGRRGWGGEVCLRWGGWGGEGVFVVVLSAGVQLL